jgi:hypothetical protein
MDPKEVAEVYIAQAKALQRFTESLEYSNHSKEEYKYMLQIICLRYHELLISLSNQAEALEAHNIKFFKIVDDQKSNANKLLKGITEPPFDKDYFYGHKDI